MTRISATMLRDLLLCERKMELDLRGAPELREATSPFVEMLWRDGLSHEDEVLDALPGEIVDLRKLAVREREAATQFAIQNGATTILGSVITHADLIGMPDVLHWTDKGHMALDVKAGSAVEGPRSTYKLPYLVQVAHYAAILAATGLGRGDVAGIIDRDGELFEYDLHRPVGRDKSTAIQRHLGLLATARAVRDMTHSTRAALSASCGLCGWRAACRKELAEADDLTQLAGLGRANRAALEFLVADVRSLAELDVGSAQMSGIPGLGAERLSRFVQRAQLWVDLDAGPVIREPFRLPQNSHRIDFDVESDPVRGLVYLHGFWHDRDDQDGFFVHFFAPTLDAAGEREAFARAIEHFHEYRTAHWYHYSAYERTAYAGLQRRHPTICSEADLAQIFASERCTDLYQIVAQNTDWPLTSYGIKSIAKACGFSWSDVDPGGAASIEWFDRYARTGDPALRNRIIVYNRDDVRASKVVRDALHELDTTGSVAAFRRPTL